MNVLETVGHFEAYLVMVLSVCLWVTHEDEQDFWLSYISIRLFVTIRQGFVARSCKTRPLFLQVFL